MLPACTRPTVVALAAIVLFTGCAGHPPQKPFFSRFGGFEFPDWKRLLPPPADRPDNYWEERKAGGAPSIVVRLDEQRAYFYRGRKVVGAAKISSGKRGFATPRGSYAVIQKNRHHVSNLYGDYVDATGEVVMRNVDVKKDAAPEGASFRGAKMPYFLRFDGGYGLHAGRVPNYPASHGCVRLPADMAKLFYENAQVGTPIRVE